jgi:hypothetical protein
MNYYDELGVRQDASERDIRQAYRVLVRVLHPDVQTGDDLRLAAERQLNRLNEMLAVLTNAETRRAYDLELAQGSTPRGPVTPVRPGPGRAVRASPMPSGTSLTQFALKHWTIILICLVIFSAAALSALIHGNEFVEERQMALPPRQPAAVKPVAPNPSPQPVPPSPQAVASPEPQLASSTRRIEAPKGKASVAKPLLLSQEIPSAWSGSIDSRHNLETIADEGVATPYGPEPTRPSPPPAQTSAFSFAGNWLYTTGLSSSQQSEGYRAIYVELLLSETHGALSGDYRARYVVPDRAISPQVSFHLQGQTSSERKARASWSSANGARGEAELSLSAPGIMDIRWWTMDLAEQSGLSSGFAKLVRQRTP